MSARGDDLAGTMKPMTLDDKKLTATFSITFSERDSRLLEAIAKFKGYDVNRVLADISGAVLWQKHVENTVERLREKFGSLVSL